MYRVSSSAYTCPPMTSQDASLRENGVRFESTADAIMYRWSTERDTWVSKDEVEQARAYLERQGVLTRSLPDGRFAVAGDGETLGAAHLVLLGLRRLHTARRARAHP